MRCDQYGYHLHAHPELEPCPHHCDWLSGQTTRDFHDLEEQHRAEREAGVSTPEQAQARTSTPVPKTRSDPREGLVPGAARGPGDAATGAVSRLRTSPGGMLPAAWRRDLWEVPNVPSVLKDPNGNRVQGLNKPLGESLRVCTAVVTSRIASHTCSRVLFSLKCLQRSFFCRWSSSTGRPGDLDRAVAAAGGDWAISMGKQ